MSVAPESIMPVACKEDVYGLVFLAGLKLAVLVHCYLDFLKLKLCVLTVPHRHKAPPRLEKRFVTVGDSKH